MKKSSTQFSLRNTQFNPNIKLQLQFPQLLSPEEIGVQNLSEFLLRIGPTLCKVDELMTEGPCRNGVMGAVAEVGG